MYVKTTKGIYELNENRRIEHFEVTTPKTLLLDHSKDNPFEKGKKSVEGLGEVVAQSDNLGELIDKCAFIDKERNVRNVYPNKITYPHEIYNNLNVIGMIWCGNDLVKVADWDNEKGEWKLYER